MAKKLDSFLYVCFYMVIYWFSKILVVAVVPFIEAIKLLIEGRTGFVRVWERFVYIVNISDKSSLWVTIAALVLTLLLVWLIFAIRKKRFLGFFQTKRLYVSVIAAIFLIAFGLNAITLLVMKIPFPQYFYDSHATLINRSVSGSLWTVVLVVGILSPIFEELLFRGVVFSEFSSSGGFFFANFFQSLFFAVMHFNFLQGLYAFLIGFSLGAVYRRTKNLYIPIAIHILFNLSNIFFGDYIIGFSIMSYFMVCGLIAFVLGYLLLWKK